jgi:hypothetical protein
VGDLDDRLDFGRQVRRDGYSSSLRCGRAARSQPLPLTQTILHRIGANDSKTFGWSALLLAVVALLASYVPAGRATLADPVEGATPRLKQG